MCRVATVCVCLCVCVCMPVYEVAHHLLFFLSWRLVAERERERTCVGVCCVCVNMDEVVHDMGLEFVVGYGRREHGVLGAVSLRKSGRIGSRGM